MPATIHIEKRVATLRELEKNIARCREIVQGMEQKRTAQHAAELVAFIELNRDGCIPKRDRDLFQGCAVPEWANETPPDHSYSLDMYQNSDVSIQSVELTRQEYIKLKVHLAEMRGLTPSKQGTP